MLNNFSPHLNTAQYSECITLNTYICSAVLFKRDSVTNFILHDSFHLSTTMVSIVPRNSYRKYRLHCIVDPMDYGFMLRGNFY